MLRFLLGPDGKKQLIVSFLTLAALIGLAVGLGALELPTPHILIGVVIAALFYGGISYLYDVAGWFLGRFVGVSDDHELSVAQPRQLRRTRRWDEKNRL